MEWCSPDVSKENTRREEEIDYFVRLLPTIQQHFGLFSTFSMIFVPLEVSQVKWF